MADPGQKDKKARTPGPAGQALFLWTVCLDTVLIYFGQYAPIRRSQNFHSILQGAEPAMVFWLVVLADLLSLVFTARLVMAMIPPSARRRRWLAAIVGLPVLYLGWLAFDYSVVRLAINVSAQSGLVGPLLVVPAGLLAAGCASLFFALAVAEGSGGLRRQVPGLFIRLLPFAAVMGIIVFALRYCMYVLLALPIVGPLLLATGNLWITLWFAKALPGLVSAGSQGDPPGQPGLFQAVAGGFITAGVALFSFIIPGPPHHLDAVSAPPLAPYERSVAPTGIEKRGDKLIVESEDMTLVIGQDPFEFAVVDKDRSRVLMKLMRDPERAAPYRGVTVNREYRAMRMIPFTDPGMLLESRARTRTMVMERADELQVTAGRIVAESRLGLRPITVTFSFFDDEVLKITVDSGSRSPVRSTSIAFHAGPAEHFMGMGSIAGIDRRGAAADLVVESGEHGPSFAGAWLTKLTRGRLEVTAGRTDRSWPAPFLYMSRGAGLFVAETTDPRFEVASVYPDAVRISGRGGTLELYLISGYTPAEILRKFNSITAGKARPPAGALLPWAVTRIPDEGEGKKPLTSLIREQGLPCQYVHLEGGLPCPPLGDDTCARAAAFVKQGLSQGFRFTYQDRAWVKKGTELYRLAVDKGYLVANRVGLPYQFIGRHGVQGMLDYTNPAAVRWRGSYWRRMQELGFDGLALDPSALTPPQSVLYSGENGYVSRNQYPVIYGRVARETLGPSALIIAASGFTGVEMYAAISMPGPDARGRGEGGAGPGAALTRRVAHLADMGVSGAPLCLMPSLPGFQAPAPLIELPDIRGMEKAHLKWLRDFARMHSRLFPYYHSLARMKVELGLPAARPLAVTDPSDGRLYSITDQYMIGNAIMAAPGAAASGKVRFPPGRWMNIDTLAVREGGEAAPSGGRTPVYLAEGSVLPVFDDWFETFSGPAGVQESGAMEGEAGPVRGSLQGDMTLLWLFGPPGYFELYDGARISARQAGETALLRVSGGAGRGYTFRLFECPRPKALYINGLRLRSRDYEYRERIRVLTVPSIPGPDIELKLIVME